MPIIHRVRLGTCNTYLIQGSGGYVLVDAGNANREKVFFDYLGHHGISPGEIKLIVVTHVHYDHVGSLSAIKKACGCPVAVHEREAGLLREGKFIMPPGANILGKTVSCLGKRVVWTGFFRYVPVDPEITLSGEMKLNEFGINGCVTPTPGHTDGSVSVIVQTGEAFVGDLAVNFMGCLFPPFAENIPELMSSWSKIARLGAGTVYPAHGAPFSIALLKKRRDLLTRTLNADFQPT